MEYPIKSPRKLIEVALPLDAINQASALEKQPFTRKHPRSLHIWWARRPFVTARAVLFAQLVNDPGYQQGGGFKYGKNKKEASEERRRLFKIIQDLVQWENTNNEEVLGRARAEIRRSWGEVCELNKDHPQAAEIFNPNQLPAIHDPFAGGGAIPIEAQRLGLEAHASDLNPVAVLINKAMIELPAKFADRQPIGAGSKDKRGAKLNFHEGWRGATGLMDDVRFYGQWMISEAKRRIGHLYPTVKITAGMAKDRPDLNHLVGKSLEVVGYCWARTVKSPNPGFSHIDVPLASTFVLSTKSGKEAFVQPVVTGESYSFTVKMGTPPAEAKGGTKLARGANFSCLMSKTPIEPDYIKSEGAAGRMGTKLMAIIADGVRTRIYLPPTPEMESAARAAEPTWKPDLKLSEDKRAFWTPAYGVTTYGDLFTPRQLVALSTFSDLAIEAIERVRSDGGKAGIPNDEIGLEAGGSGLAAYSEAVGVYLALAVSRWADLNNSICTWNATNNNVRALFSRQAIPMSWDFVELSAFAPIAGFDSILNSFVELSQSLPASAPAFVSQADAQRQKISANKVISTDPPYYDNIGYADLSDFFYVWLRRTLRQVLPGLFSTIAVPKAEELVATPYRHGSKDNAETFFLAGMTDAMHSLAEQAHPELPVTIYYAFKQSDTDTDSGTSSTGWVTFLDAVLRAGFQITGTWPMRTEREARSISIGTNSLASSIILVCRKRASDAPTVSRREFLRELNAVLPEALDEMTKGSGEDRSPVAPVDLSQAIIGPGMAVFSKYSSVLEADGSVMSVRTALQLINKFLAEDDFDGDTQFCLHWFEQHGWSEGLFGDADVLARAKATSVGGLVEDGVAFGEGGKVRLRKWAEYPTDWDPMKDKRIPIWEVLHQLTRALKQDGETAAGKLLAQLKGKSEATRQLAYRLYTLCERQGWTDDAHAYNELVTSWSGIESAAGEVSLPNQMNLFGDKQ